MDLKTIVALEIGSSKIKGAIGAVAPDGRLTVLAVEELPAANNVRYGRIQNIREVARTISDIIKRLEAARPVQGRKVEGLAIALGGRSLSAVPAESVLHFPQECEITEQQVARLKQEASRDYMMCDTHMIEAIVPRKFYVNKTAVPRAVGTFGETLRGEFLLITCGKETHQNLDRLKLDPIQHDDVRYALRPTAIADFVLSRDEKAVGTALVDVGAETTTVATYKGGSLASLVTIPMGSSLITKDLMTGLGITEEAAEAIKVSLTSLDPNDKADRIVNAPEVKAYVRARAGEIIANALNQINLSPTPLNSLGNIVLTGGGSRLADFAKLVNAQAKIPVRMATVPEGITFQTPGRNTPDNIDILSILTVATRIPGLKGLSPVRAVEPEEEPVTAAPVTTEEKKPEPAPVEKPVKKEEPVFEPKKPTRRAFDDDDEELLKDDPDEVAPVKAKEPKKKSFFSTLFKMRKDDPDEEEDGENLGEEVNEGENIDDISYPDEPQTQDSSIGTRVDSLAEKLSRLLGPEEENDNDD